MHPTQQYHVMLLFLEIHQKEHRNLLTFDIQASRHCEVPSSTPKKFVEPNPSLNRRCKSDTNDSCEHGASIYDGEKHAGPPFVVADHVSYCGVGVPRAWDALSLRIPYK